MASPSQQVGMPNAVSAASIKSVQRNDITIGSGASTATSTIQAVNPLKTELRFLGCAPTGANLYDGMVKINLTNATTITATRGGTGAAVTVSWELTEYY